MRPEALGDEILAALAREHGTPLFVYDAASVRERIERLRGFDRIRYAQKANPNLALLELVRASGCAVDAVSAGELVRALRAGFAPEEIAFTADLFERAALELVREHACDVNLGSIAMIEQLTRVSPGREVMLRINPGFGHGHDPTVETGGEASKHGIWHEDLPLAFETAREHGLVVRGLHVHVGSGCDLASLLSPRDALARFAAEAPKTVTSISAGGGLPVRYREEDAELDVEAYVEGWRTARATLERRLGRKLALETEPGRYLVAEAGVLVCEVRATKRVGRYDFVLVDAGFNDLVRPALYGAHHRITAIGRSGALAPKVVAGPLCESGDVFTRTREGALEPQLLPDVREGDLLCIHDAGAYAASMASTYNSRPLAAEVLVDGGRSRLVRRRQPLAELLELEEPSAQAPTASRPP